MARDAVVIGLQLAGELRPVVDHHQVLLDVWPEHLHVVVGAEVVVEVEALEADEPVELEPFGQVLGLVAIDRTGSAR